MQKISQLAATGQILLLLGTHLYFTFRLRFIQRKIPCGIRLSFSGKNNTSYSALATALAATIGTGNIIGISTAIAVGGAGAVFWCWITGVLGIATCYGECFLSMKYRKTEKDGKRIGGPMYVLERGMQQKGLAVLFSVFTILASLGIGSSVQAHSISAAITEQIPVSPHRHGSGGACGEGDHRWQPADWKSMYLAGSCDECILFRRMYFYPDEKLYGDPGGSKNDRDLCVCAGGCRRGGGWDNGDGGVKNRDFQRAFYK